MIKPTREAYAELQTAYDFFNRELFNEKLPNCLITMQRDKISYGFFSGDRWVNRAGKMTDEIAMNPIYFENSPIDEVLSTLVHEMVHLWQKHFGSPGRTRYHNKEWADKMEAIGLMPSDTGEPGGHKTGDRISDYIIKNGFFSKYQKKLAIKGFNISWVDRNSKGATGGVKGNKKDKSTRQRYICPECSIKAWAKAGLFLICGECNEELQAE